MADRIPVARSGIGTPELTSEERTEPFSQSEIDVKFRGFGDETQTQISGFSDVPLENLQVDEYHQHQGIRLLLRPSGVLNIPSNNTSSKVNRPTIVTSDKTKLLALRGEGAQSDQHEHKVLAVIQTPKDVKFSVRIPGDTQDRGGSPRPPLWCEIYYDPASDNVILLNRSDIPITLCQVAKAIQGNEPPAVVYITNPALMRALSPGTWRIKVRDVDVLDFRVLEKRQPTVYREIAPEVLQEESVLSSSGQIKATAKRQLSPGRQSHGKRIQYYPPEKTDAGDGAIQFLPSAAEPLIFSLPAGSQSEDPSMPPGNKLLLATSGDRVVVPGVCELDEYELTRREPVSSTGLSTVFTAHHSKVSEKLVTVKVLKAKPNNLPSKAHVYERNVIRQADSWLRESQLLGDVEHESIVRYYGGDARFLSLYVEHNDAPSLSTAQKWMNKADGYFLGERHDALHILKDIISALDYLHERQLVHNDVKPANILYSSERGAVLCDFGLSTPAQNSPAGGGTPYYVPPEYIGTKLRGPSGDIWALGITMLYVLRMIPLPDRRARRIDPRPLYWLIAEINNPSRVQARQLGNGLPAASQMREWLTEIFEVRKKLEKDWLVEGIVFELLDPNPNLRIKAKPVLQELQNDEEQLPFLGTNSVRVRSRLLVTDFMDNFHIDIFNHSFAGLPDDETFSQTRERLALYLQEFAELITQEHENQWSFAISAFVLENRVQITARFVDYFIQAKNGDKRKIHESARTKSWSADASERPQADGIETNYSIPEAEVIERPHGEIRWLNYLATASGIDPRMWCDKFVTQSRAFKRLVANVRGDTYDPAAMMEYSYMSTQIRELLGSLQTNQLIAGSASQLKPSPVFYTDWDPIAFVNEQEYSEQPDIAVAGAITVTGVDNGNVEAMTCSEYLNRTWPLLGHELMEHIKAVLRSALGTRTFAALRDDTFLTSWIEPNGCLAIEILGILDAIIEVGLAVAWMTAAVRSSSSETAAFVTPVFNLRDDSGKETVRIAISNKWSQIESKPVGQCWQALFRNPAVVLGFPIRRRQLEQQGPGLELPLNMLAALVDTQRVSIFDDQILLKGFCTLLLPTSYSGNIVYWHVVFNKDGSRISAADPRVRKIAGNFRLLQHLALADIETARHVVGWCAQALNFAGSKDAKYDIGRTDLDKPPSTFSFDRVSISAGKFISLGFSGVIGRKDRPVRKGKVSEFHKQLEWIEQRFVILYDTGDNRAWLIDGLSALLHVVRASILHRKNLGYPILLNSGDVKEAEPFFTGKAAARAVLLNDHNMALRVYKNPDRVVVKNIQKTNGDIESITETQTTWTHFSDKVGDIYSILWNIFDHIIDESSKDGIGAGIRTSHKERLEGFDFMDVASETDPMEPKSTILQGTGSGWIDFARAIQAITLFGNGFGDILRPATAVIQPAYVDQGPGIPCTTGAVPVQKQVTRTSLCTHWSQLPKGQDLLAVGTAELQYILSRNPRQTKGQQFWELTKDQYWHSPDMTFENCSCSDTSGMQCDRVQVLLPTKFPKLFARGFRSPVTPLPDNGAVVFGQGPTFPPRWGPKPKSTPKELHLSCPAATSQDPSILSDSGLGASLGNSSSRGTSPNGASNIAPAILEPVNTQGNVASKRTAKVWHDIWSSIT